MARVGGRSAWIAWPTGAFCVAVIAVLLWLAAPGIPGAIAFVGDTLRSATSAPVAGDAAQGGEPQEPATDCRSLYPDRLWAELTWTPDVLLSQNTAAPAGSTGLVQALAPQVRFTCAWRADAGRAISTTLSTVSSGAASIAQAALSSEGFACETEGQRVHCTRTRGGVSEIHDVGAELWLSSVLTSWEPDDYGAQTASRAFAG